MNWRALLSRRPRCARCGLRLEVQTASARDSLDVPPEAWAARCKAKTADMMTPLECTHLREAWRDWADRSGEA